jgi:3-oxoacyl-[acyl-carrier-protein] synthase-3
MAVGILGVGSYVPPTIRTNDWWGEEFRQKFNERRANDVTSPEILLSRAKSPAQRVQFEHMLETYNDPFRGTVERRILDPKLPPSFMEIEAAKKALHHSKVDAGDIDAIIVYSAPADFVAPCNGGAIQAAIGAPRAQTLGVDSGCASFISGMMVAESLIRAGQARTILVVASGTQSRLADPADPGAVNFGDGAGAVVIGSVPPGYGFEAFAIRSVSQFNKAICVAPLHDDPWYEGGGPMILHSKHLELGREVIANSGDMAVEAVNTVLRRAGIEKRDITHWYSHQPVSWFSAACRAAAGLSHARAVNTFPRYAGMGPGNIGVNLDTAVESGDLNPGSKVLLYSCGAGFLWAACVVTWSRQA